MVFETLAKKAFEELYPEKDFIQYFNIRFSARFRDFNANVQYNFSKYEILFSLSSEWKDIDEDIIKGLFQHLYLKLFEKKYKPVSKETVYTNMYESFLDNLGKFVSTSDINPVLEDSFDRMNLTFFDGLLEKPNLIWGEKTKRKMGHYDYQRDTIMISQTLKDRMDLVDFVMYHEMLHKKHQFYKTQSGRRMHHHTAFREEEKQYPGFEKLETELSKHVSSFRQTSRKATAAKKAKKLDKKWFKLW